MKNHLRRLLIGMALNWLVVPAERSHGQLWARWPCKEQKSDLAARYRDGPCQTAMVPCPLQLKRLLAPSTPIRLAPGLQSFTSFFPFPLFLLLPASSLVGLVTLSLRLGPPSDLPFSLPIYHSFIGINSLAQPWGQVVTTLARSTTRPARLPAPFVRTRAIVPIRQSCIFSTLV